MKVGSICVGGFLLLSGCAAPSHNAGDTAGFCEHLADYISSQYVSLPASYERYRYDRHEGTLTLWGPAEAEETGTASPIPAKNFVNLSQVPSAYDVLFQHQGRDAVVSYCLSRY